MVCRPVGRSVIISYHFNASIGALVFLRSPLSSLMYIVKKVVALNVLYNENNLNFLMWYFPEACNKCGTGEEMALCRTEIKVHTWISGKIVLIYTNFQYFVQGRAEEWFLVRVYTWPYRPTLSSNTYIYVCMCISYSINHLYLIVPCKLRK